MRFEKGKVVTLEMDIIKAWDKHGWDVEVIETKKGGIWIRELKINIDDLIKSLLKELKEGEEVLIRVKR